MTQPTLGIMGGSGLYDIEGIQDLQTKEVSTPFGAPSGAFKIGKLHDTQVIFLPRHGYHHEYLPSEVNYRANVYAMKKLGVEFLLSISAVGSLKEDIAPGDFVLPTQFFDRTHGRCSTFFGDGLVAHVPFGQPICAKLQTIVQQACEHVGVKTHVGGTYVNIEGPIFSSQAESRFYRSIDASVVGMTNATEAKLAREAEISYVTLALSTDYDSWREGEPDIDAMSILEVMRSNISRAKDVIRKVSQNMCEGPSPLKGVLSKSIVGLDHAPQETREKLSILLQDL